MQKFLLSRARPSSLASQLGCGLDLYLHVYDMSTETGCTATRFRHAVTQRRRREGGIEKGRRKEKGEKERGKGKKPPANPVFRRRRATHPDTAEPPAHHHPTSPTTASRNDAQSYCTGAATVRYVPRQHAPPTTPPVLPPSLRGTGRGGGRAMQQTLSSSRSFGPGPFRRPSRCVGARCDRGPAPLGRASTDRRLVPLVLPSRRGRVACCPSHCSRPSPRCRVRRARLCKLSCGLRFWWAFARAAPNLLVVVASWVLAASACACTSPQAYATRWKRPGKSQPARPRHAVRCGCHCTVADYLPR